MPLTEPAPPRTAPPGPHGALRARGDDVRPRHRTAVRLRPRAAHDPRSPSTACVFEGGRTAMTVAWSASPTTSGWPTGWTSDGDVHAEVTLRPGRCAAWSWRPAPPGRCGRSRSPRRGGCSTTPSGSGEAWLGQLHLPRPVAGDPQPFRHHPQTHDVRADRRPGGGRPPRRLPEQIGGERNWDYRYTWVRDASFSVYSLLGHGLHATRPPRSAAGCATGSTSTADGAAASPLKIMYRVDGSSRPDRGGPRPLGGLPRLGAGADRQRRRRPAAAGHLRRGAGQHLRSPTGTVSRLGQQGWLRICDLLDWVSENWDQPEEGIWETRGGRQDFTYGRLMYWVALDRGIRLADRARPAGPAGALAPGAGRASTARSWTGAGARPGRRSASTTPPTSSTRRCCGCPRSASSRRATRCGRRPWTAMDDELVTDSLVYRYDPAASPDGLRGSRGHLLAVHVRLRRRPGPRPGSSTRRG